MKVLVCGGRNFTDTDSLKKMLDNLNPSAIIQGGASGADQLARSYAKSNGIPSIQVDANWTYYNKSAGPVRNKWMLEFCQPDVVVAFPTPESRGTWHMVKIAKEAGVKTIVCTE